METSVNSRFASSAIPFLSYVLGGSDFILLSLTAGLTKISSGFPVIRLAVAIERSHLLMKAEDAKEHYHRISTQYKRLVITDDSSCFEDVLVISFHTDGR
jgi:hypothetical protein